MRLGCSEERARSRRSGPIVRVNVYVNEKKAVYHHTCCQLYKAKWMEEHLLRQLLAGERTEILAILVARSE